MGKTWQKYMTFLAVLCMLVCLVLTVGITYARYQSEFSRRSYIFTPAAPNEIRLYGGGISDAWINGGTLPSLDDTWEKTETGAKLDFSVTNGQIGSFSQEDQTYVIRLAAGLSIQDPGNLTVTLHWTDAEDQSHSVTAVAEAIETGSLLYDTYGDGWVYRFYTGWSEDKFTLTGGSLQYCNYTVTVSGNVEPTLLKLQVLRLNEQ